MLVMIASFVTFIKGLPAKVWTWLQRQLSVTITVVDNDSAFAMTREWIQKLPFTTKSRRVDAIVERQAKTKRVRNVREVAKQRGFKPITPTQEDERFDRATRF
jgi:hypothetical protein